MHDGFNTVVAPFVPPGDVPTWQVSAAWLPVGVHEAVPLGGVTGALPDIIHVAGLFELDGTKVTPDPFTVVLAVFH
jgi:hypothetical protein